MKSKVYNLMHNNSYFNYFMFLMIIISILPLFFKKEYQIFNYTEIITTTVFIIDYIVRWSTINLVYNTKKAYLYYPITPYAIIDMLSILPSITVLNSGFRMFRVLRLSKISKTLELLKYSSNFNLLMKVIKKEKKPLLAICWLSIGYVIISALTLFVAEPDTFDSSFDAFYWAVVTLTTVGYGDIFPVTVLGKIFGMISAFLGIAIVALPTGIIASGYIEEVTSKDCEVKA